MERSEILRHIDHTALAPSVTQAQIGELCEQAMEWKTASVCIPPNFVAWAYHHFPGLNLCTVIGFPLGYHTTAAKLYEARQAIANGADELDMVVNLGDVKSGLFDCVTSEIRLMKHCLLYTSASMNVKYVIIGHSERRTYFGETDVTVNKRVRAALDLSLIHI